MTLDELKTELLAHDWLGEMSDSWQIVSRAKENERRLKAAAQALGDDGKRAFNHAHELAWRNNATMNYQAQFKLHERHSKEGG